jgi:hypothetical protein
MDTGARQVSARPLGGRMRLVAKWTVGIVILLAFAALLSPVALYWYGLTLLPADRDPAGPSAVPPMARDLLWRELGGHGSPAMPILNPYTHFTQPSGPGMRLAVSAGRALLKKADAPRRWMPAFYSSVVWASRNWSTEEALSTILARAYYGHDLFRFDAAAQAYFGLPASALTRFETAQLVALTMSSSRYDPWCANAASRTHASELAGSEASHSPPRLRPTPEGACS